MWRGTAGVSSMDLAVTKEPALQHRKHSPSKRQQRKTPPLSHTVDALLDPGDGIGKSRSQVKVCDVVVVAVLVMCICSLA